MIQGLIREPLPLEDMNLSPKTMRRSDTIRH
jgi:hypothetical protein